MSAKCDEPIDEIAVQVWLMYYHPNFKYCTLYAGQNITDRQTDRQTDGRTDGQTIRLLDAPADLSGAKNGTQSAKMVSECTICILFSNISLESPSDPLFRRKYQSRKPTAVPPLI